MKKLQKLLLVGSMIALPAVSQAEGISSGELIATTCFQCHGSEGKFTNGNMPPLAGYPEQFMAMRLKQYVTGELYGTIMQRHMKGYSNEEIEALAKYFSALDPS